MPLDAPLGNAGGWATPFSAACPRQSAPFYNPRMIIKVYGEFWSRSRVDWKKQTLPGKRKGKGPCDIWNQSGIYALYKDFAIVYVGQSDSRGIGVRLREHCKGRLAERWDSFSFFGICVVDKQGQAKPASRMSVEPKSAITSLELLAILLSDAPLNRARGNFPGADKVWQVGTRNAGQLCAARGC